MSGLARPHVFRRWYCCGLSGTESPRCRFSSLWWLVRARNHNRSTDVLRCSSLFCVEPVWQCCSVHAGSQFLRCPQSFHVFSHCQSQVVLFHFPTDRFFFGPIMKATFVMAASVCGAWFSSESHWRIGEPGSAGVHGHCVAWKTTLVLTGCRSLLLCLKSCLCASCSVLQDHLDHWCESVRRL